MQQLAHRAVSGVLSLPGPALVALSRRRPVVAGGERLAPELQFLLALPGPRLAEMEPAEVRLRMRAHARMLAGRLPAVGPVRDVAVDGGAGRLRARHYAPRDPRENGLLVWFHGGGFTIGDLETHDLPCRLLCHHGGLHVLSVDYRLAPEHPFPAATDDGHAALRWALAHARDLGADPSRVLVGGDSAGANISAVLGQAMARGEAPAFAGQVLVYPSIDYTDSQESTRTYAEGFGLDRDLRAWFRRHYYEEATGLPPSDPRLSPGLADLAPGLPPAVVVTAALDPVRDEGEAYADKLRAVGTQVFSARMPGLIHGFVQLAGVSRACRTATAIVAHRAREILDPGRSPSPRPPDR